MILKLRAQRFASVLDPSDGWVYVDRIRKVQTYPLLDPAAVEGDSGSPPPKRALRVFTDSKELDEHVSSVWGPPEDRQFIDEIWPDWPREHSLHRNILAVRCDLEDGEMVLALIGDQAFLLGDDGRTVERLWR